jgi:hypothetical protein
LAQRATWALFPSRISSLRQPKPTTYGNRPERPKRTLAFPRRLDLEREEVRAIGSVGRWRSPGQGPDSPRAIGFSAPGDVHPQKPLGVERTAAKAFRMRSLDKPVGRLSALDLSVVAFAGLVVVPNYAFAIDDECETGLEPVGPILEAASARARLRFPRRRGESA